MRAKILQLLLAAGLGLPAFTVAAAAQGNDSTITFTNNSSFFADGYETLNIHTWSPSKTLSNQPVGGFQATTIVPVPVGDGATNLFWCTDLPQSLIWGAGNYTAYSFTAANPGAQYPNDPPSSTQAGQITSLLYNQEANAGNASELGKLSGSSQSIWSAATQLAIWAVLYDTSTTGYNITSWQQNFWVSGYSGNATTAVNDADSLLGCVATGSGCPSGWGAPSASYSAINFIPGNAQSVGFLTMNTGSNQSPVPEPSTLDLLTAGLLGLTLFRRRTSGSTRG